MRTPTRYDDPDKASDGRGGPHTLAGVPQEALDAALAALKGMVTTLKVGDDILSVLDVQQDGTDDDLRAIAEAILAEALEASKAATGEHPYQHTTTIPAGRPHSS